MTAANVHDQFQKLLDDNKKFKTFHEALSLFSMQSESDPKLTVAGAMIKHDSALDTEELKKILWINMELHTQDSRAEKASKMRPVAVWSADSEKVDELHKDFFTNRQAWETKVEQEKWIALSEIMDNSCYKEQKNLYLFVAISDCIHFKDLTQLSFYTDNHLMIIYPCQTGHNNACSSGKCSDKKYFMRHNKSEPKEVNTTIDSKRFFIRQIEWLKEYGDDTKKVRLYMGYESKIKHNMRLWAAFTDVVSKECILAIILFYEKIHNHYLSDLRKTLVSGNLEEFWNATSGIDIHNLPGTGLKALSELLGLSENEKWPYNLGCDKDIKECLTYSQKGNCNGCKLVDCLKTVCGKTSCFYSNDIGSSKPLSLMGAFFVFLSTFLLKNNQLPPVSIVQVENVSAESVLPRQSNNLSKSTVDAMRDMFENLIMDESNVSAVTMINLGQDALKITLNIKPDQKPFLDATLRYFMAAQQGKTIAGKQPGNTTKSIHKYWSLSHASDVQPSEMDHRTVFPPDGGMKIRFTNESVVLVISALK